MKIINIQKKKRKRHGEKDSKIFLVKKSKTGKVYEKNYFFPGKLLLQRNKIRDV